ncbi:MAG: TonB-dependent receptor domain-containing protein [Niabella sp.]
MLFKVSAIWVFIVCIANHIYAQKDIIDSVKSLSEVTVKTTGIMVSNSTTSAIVNKIETIPIHNKASLVQVVNTITGVRMEERSPGSYRMNIRGSSLRSPFGVRNVKVYWNNIPLTDPGGTTYFNQITITNLSSLTIIKGPVSALYGQGTGGVVLINNQPEEHTSSVEFATGSYNNQTITAKAVWEKDTVVKNAVTYQYNYGNGYREQSALRRNNLSWVSKITTNKKHKLTASVLYSDLYYQTPGGLTLGEFTENPRASRPATNFYPSAKDAHAAIWQKNFTAGFTHDFVINKTFKQSTTVYGAMALVKNASVRNYERRTEPHFGLRSILSFKKNIGQKSNHLSWDNGIEIQQGYFNTQVFGNINGQSDTLQTNDDITTGLYSFISQALLQFSPRLTVIAGASINVNRFNFSRLSVQPVQEQIFKYKNELAPRFAVNYRPSPYWQFDVYISKGFSPPSVAEILPSTGIITPLQAEHGWNYELRTERRIPTIGITIDCSAYIFNLTDALAQRRDAAGADYFVNAGEVNQHGLEMGVQHVLVAREGSFVDYVANTVGYTFNHSKYGDFIKEATDYTKKNVPGIPKHTIVYSGNLVLKNGFQFALNYYAASAMYLNDANTAKAKSYYLLGLKFGKKAFVIKRLAYTVYAGADNLFNQLYSFGNDINAAGGRYYNAAPRRNYYAGISFELGKRDNSKQPY